MRYLSEEFHNILNWSEEFDKADVDRKKMILSRMIQSITVDKGYHITINFFISQEEFEKEMNSVSDKLSVKESEKAIDQTVRARSNAS